jgi:hypothetical protein
MAWYTITELKTPTEQKVVFDGKSTKAAALSAMAELHKATGARVVVTKGKRLGKFLAEAA